MFKALNVHFHTVFVAIFRILVYGRFYARVVITTYTTIPTTRSPHQSRGERVDAATLDKWKVYTV